MPYGIYNGVYFFNSSTGKITNAHVPDHAAIDLEEEFVFTKKDKAKYGRTVTAKTKPGSKAKAVDSEKRPKAKANRTTKTKR